METIILKRFFHKNQNCIGIYFPYNHGLACLVRQVPGATWSYTKRCWRVENNPQNLKEIFRLFKGVAKVNSSEVFNPPKENVAETIETKTVVIQKRSGTMANEMKINNEKVELVDKVKIKLEEFKRWLRSRRYSESTVKTYTDGLKSFLMFYSVKPISEINNNDVIVTL